MAADGRGSLWKHLRGLLPSDCHATRIENEIGSGFPDVHCTYRGRTCSIELKKAEKAPLGKRGLRKAQLDWIKEETEAGGQVWIIAQIGSTIYAISGIYAARFNDYYVDGLSDIATVTWKIGEGDPDVIYGLLMN